VTAKFRLDAVRDLREWDAFVEESPEATLFSTSAFLRATGREFALWLVLKGDEPRAGVCLIQARDGKGFELDDLVIHNGVFFAGESEGAVKNRVSRGNEQFELIEFLAAELAARHPRLEMSLSPGITDLRPFLWYNYHEPDRPHFRLDLRYTAYLDISEIQDGSPESGSPVVAGLGASRRQELRYGRKAGVRGERIVDPEPLLSLYFATMRRQGIPDQDLRGATARIRRVIQALQAERRGQLYAVRHSGSGEVVSTAMFGWDSKRAYYLYGGNDAERQERFSGTVVLWDALIDLRERGLRQVDFEGVNSPGRGWFKATFGGALVPYFQVFLNEGTPRP